MQEKQKHITKLLQACIEGSASAQFKVYKLYHKAMYNTALRIMNDRFEAEDMMQEAFLNAFAKLNSFKGEVAFGAWLKRIVINKCLTQLKNNNRLASVHLGYYKNVLAVAEEEVPEEIIESNIKAKEVVMQIKKLKDNYRIALTLSLIEGYDNEEVSQIMNISNENCRTIISRAKVKLRSLLVAVASVK